MTPKQMLPGIILWIFVILGWAQIFSATVNMVLCYVGFVLLAVHLIEFLFVQKKIKAQGDSALMGFVYTMLFGFVYWTRK